MAKPDFKASGRVNLGWRDNDRFSRADFPKDAVLQLETKRQGGVKGAFDVRASDDARGAELREVFIDYKSGTEGGTELRFIAGRSKKRFGLQWDYDLERTLGLTRGAIYRKLAGLGYNGRDTFVAFQVADEDDVGVSHRVSLHTSDGINGALLYRYTLRKGEGWLLASYSLFQVEYVDEQRIPCGAQAVAFSGALGHWRLDVEGFAGADAFETEFQRIGGDGRTVFFAAAQAGAEWRAWSLRPYLILSGILDDLAETGRSTLEAAVGARYYFQPRFYLGAEGRFVQSKAAGVTAFDTSSQALVALRYFF